MIVKVVDRMVHGLQLKVLNPRTRQPLGPEGLTVHPADHEAVKFWLREQAAGDVVCAFDDEDVKHGHADEATAPPKKGT